MHDLRKKGAAEYDTQEKGSASPGSKALSSERVRCQKMVHALVHFLQLVLFHALRELQQKSVFV